MFISFFFLFYYAKLETTLQAILQTTLQAILQSTLLATLKVNVTFDSRMPLNVCDSFFLAVLKISEGLVFLQTSHDCKLLP